MPDFYIKPRGEISIEFLNRGLLSFKEAAVFVRNLPYKRNSNKKDLTNVFKEKCGTCSTKHGVLKRLAEENEFDGIELIMGIFKMNRENTPKISPVLTEYKLQYIPEAHNYLKFHKQYLDFTDETSTPSDFLNDLIEETFIDIEQLTDFKMQYHKNYLKEWVERNSLPFSSEEIWTIREKCITCLDNEKQL